MYATKKEDYASLLLKAGLVLRKGNAGKAYSGIGRLEVNEGKVTLPATLVGSPAYIAGLDIEDVILKADGSDIKTAKDFEAVTEKHQPGETIEVVYSRKGVEKITKLTFIENPSLEVLPIESTGGTLTTEMKAFRDKWLESGVK